MNTDNLPADLIDRTCNKKERIVFTSSTGEPVAALIPIEDLEYLDDLEQDKEDFLQARKEADNEPNVPWSVLKKEMDR